METGRPSALLRRQGRAHAGQRRPEKAPAIGPRGGNRSVGTGDVRSRLPLRLRASIRGCGDAVMR